MNEDYYRKREIFSSFRTWIKPQDKQIECAEEIAKRRSKKGKERKNWQNSNTIWQGKKRFI